MEREPQSVGNKFNEHASETQTRLASEALRRHQGDSPQIGASPTPQHEVIRETTHPTNDSQLSWGGGEVFISGSGPKDVPFSEELARCAGVSDVERAPTIPRSHFGQPLTSSPRVDSSWNMEDIAAGRKVRP